MAGNRVEAYSKMRLADFFTRLLNVPFEKAAEILAANLNPKESTLSKADDEGQKLKTQMKNGGVSCGGWSMVEIPYHKTGGHYSLWVLLSPVDEALMYAYESVRMEFLTECLGWDREVAETHDNPFFINTMGSRLIDKKGIDTGPFMGATGCGEITGGSFRTMMSDYGINHQLLAVRDGER